MDNKTFTPIVITSKVATKDLQDIRAKHAEILMGMQNQSLKIKAMDEQKIMQDKEKATQDAEVFKTNQEHSLKNRELDIKQQALTSI